MQSGCVLRQRQKTNTSWKEKSYPLLKKIYMVKENTQFQFCGFKYFEKGTHAKALYFFLLKLSIHLGI